MWRFRLHTGSLKDSMKSCKSFCNLKELINFAHEKASNKCFIDDINITFYCSYDERINWSPVYIVSGINEVIGFCTEILLD